MTSPGPGVEDRLPLGAPFGVGQQGLEVGGQQPLGARLQRVRQLLPELLEHLVVGRPLGVAGPVLLRVHAGHQDLLVVVRQARGHVGEAEEHGVPYDVEQRRRHQSRPLPHHLAEAAPPAVAPVLDGVVVGLADGDLLEAVALYPAVLVGPPELRAESPGRTGRGGGRASSCTLP